jgi:hypothetical protein
MILTLLADGEKGFCKKKVHNRIKITKKGTLWQYRLFAWKNIVMFAYGFAVPIDWETHQLLSKTE